MDKLSKELFNIKKKENIEVLVGQLLMNPLLKCLEDPIEKHREITINIFMKLLQEITLEKILINVLLNTILNRLGSYPFPETSEELRYKLISLLNIILEKYSEEYKSHLADLSKMLSILLKDPFPEIKTKLSEFILELSKKLQKEIGAYSKQILNSLCLNLKHQHNKVRKITINSITELLLTENAGDFLGENLDYLRVIVNDKNSDVRKNFYMNISKLLMGFNIIYLRQYESQLVLLLINGLSDDKEEIKEETKKLIEECGNNRKKLSIELGENTLNVKI